MKTDTASLFRTILESSLFRLNGQRIDLCDLILDLCHAIQSEEETDWCMGEGGECTLDSFLIGAYWSLTEWYGGQASDEYAALCAIGSIFSPGCTSAPTSDDEPEYWPYVAVNNHFARLYNRPEEIKL